MSLFGILNINKPPGCTSRDVVNRVDRLARPARCGHAGTLDPLASGVLVVCVGQATRLIRYIQRMPKRYWATFLLGRSSPTDDIEGDVTLLAGAPVPPRETIEALLPQFIGDIQQRPPEYSAIKIGGKRAYELARRGKTIELSSRTVTVYQIAIESYEYPELSLAIECGSGTYVRALGRDLSAALGTAAVMSALERSAVGAFSVANAINLDDLQSEEMLRQTLQPALSAVADLPRLALSTAEQHDTRHGLPIPKPLLSNAIDDTRSEWAAINQAGQLIAILSEKRAGQLWPLMNFGPELP